MSILDALNSVPRCQTCGYLKANPLVTGPVCRCSANAGRALEDLPKSLGTAPPPPIFAPAAMTGDQKVSGNEAVGIKNGNILKQPLK